MILLAKGTYFPDVLAALKKVLAFKRAKKSLGIRSLHAGFGARSGSGNCRRRKSWRLKQSRKRHQRIGFPAIGWKGSLASILIAQERLLFRIAAALERELNLGSRRPTTYWQGTP